MNALGIIIAVFGGVLLVALNIIHVRHYGRFVRYLESCHHEHWKSIGSPVRYGHLSSSVEVVTTVGARHGKPLVLRIHAEQMRRDGIVFYLSENAVWLTDSVPVEYIEFEGC